MAHATQVDHAPLVVAACRAKRPPGNGPPSEPRSWPGPSGPVRPCHIGSATGGRLRPEGRQAPNRAARRQQEPSRVGGDGHTLGTPQRRRSRQRLEARQMSHALQPKPTRPPPRAPRKGRAQDGHGEAGRDRPTTGRARPRRTSRSHEGRAVRQRAPGTSRLSPRSPGPARPLAVAASATEAPSHASSMPLANAKTAVAASSRRTCHGSRSRHPPARTEARLRHLQIRAYGPGSAKSE